VTLNLKAFPSGTERKLDPFYPIVDSAAWVARLLGAGALLIQLRMKNKDEATVGRETREALALCRKANAKLVVNDYWRIAVAEGAEWVHLGQEDLDTADLAAIRKAGLRLGVSTHDEAELQRGLAADPDYVALGPIFPTISKEMAFVPQGLRKIAEWKRRVGPLPLCAIGGLDLERVAALRPRLPHGVAVGAALCRAEDPQAAAARLHELIEPEES